MKRIEKNNKGQSTVEYVIVFTAIAAAIIFAVTNFIRPAVNSVYNEAGTSINRAGNFFASQIGFNFHNQVK